MKTLVVGGTGVITREIVVQLRDRGHRVTVVNRGRSTASLPEGVEHLVADRRDREGFPRAFHGRTFDAVIDALCFTPEDAEHTLGVFRRKTEHLVVLSSVAAYRRPPRAVPSCEATEEFWDDPRYTYGFNKARMEERLAARTERNPHVTIVRPSLTFGAGSRNVGVLRQNVGILERIRQGKPLLLFGDGTNPFSFSFAPDVSAAIVGLLGNTEAYGQAFHVASEELTLWRDLYLEFGRIAGSEPRLSFLPSRILYDVDPGRFAHIYFEKSYPGLYDCTELRRVMPGYYARVSLREGLEELVRSWTAEGLKPDAALDAMEDSLAAWAERRPDLEWSE